MVLPVQTVLISAKAWLEKWSPCSNNRFLPHQFCWCWSRLKQMFPVGLWLSSQRAQQHPLSRPEPQATGFPHLHYPICKSITSSPIPSLHPHPAAPHSGILFLQWKMVHSSTKENSIKINTLQSHGRGCHVQLCMVAQKYWTLLVEGGWGLSMVSKI